MVNKVVVSSGKATGRPVELTTCKVEWSKKQIRDGFAKISGGKAQGAT